MNESLLERLKGGGPPVERGSMGSDGQRLVDALPPRRGAASSCPHRPVERHQLPERQFDGAAVVGNEA